MRFRLCGNQPVRRVPMIQHAPENFDYHTGAHDTNALRSELRGPSLRGPGVPRAPEIHRPMPGIRHAMPTARGVAGGLSPERGRRGARARRPPPRPRHQSPGVYGRARAGALFRSPRASVPGDADLRAQLLLVRRRTARPVRISSLCGRAEAPVRPFDRSQINSYPVLRFFFPSLVRVRRFRAISAL